MKEDGEEKLIAKDIISLIPRGNGFVFVNISGKRYEVNNVAIEYIDFINHKVVLKKIE
ncbi:MAG: hypothetical protein DRO15_04995 [Thermoprotei archaeon]|nr:MAG: hypothetical protein DRO15_04995 [Thermoprotei archaeon]